jgi:DNA-binding NtrC family response regulator
MKRKTLLVIDDDAIFNDLLRRQLDAMGFDGVGAGSWAEAKKRLEEIEPDAIILDFKLPDTDAAKALAELRSQYPVIVLTGYGSIPNAVSAIREGAADFLTKPVNLDELEITVRRVLENAELRASNRFYRDRLASQRPGEVVLRFSGEPRLEDIERQYLFETLAKYDGNRQKTAAVLGISERHVYRLIEKYGYGEKALA